jgi:hypothetical protein
MRDGITSRIIFVKVKPRFVTCLVLSQNLWILAAGRPGLNPQGKFGAFFSPVDARRPAGRANASRMHRLFAGRVPTRCLAPNTATQVHVRPSVGSMVSRSSLTPPTARGARAFIHPFTLRFAVLADAKGQRHEHTARAWSPHVAAKGSETFSPPLAVVSETLRSLNIISI